MNALLNWALDHDNEAPRTLAFVDSCARPGRGLNVLDVGCGYGRLLKPLAGRGHQAIGVDANPAIVAANRAAGLNCFTTDEFKTDTRKFDVVVLSHIIEHLAPAALLSFLDSYLDRLAPGGHMIIATPLLSPYFYDDLDHVRPYQPTGILMFFGAGQAQVSGYGRNRVELVDIWYRRSYCRLSHKRALYVRSPLTRLVRLVNFGSAVIWRLSGGRFGRTDGWVGKFRKLEK
jgi:SAM-dependent methyltransferase